MAAVRCPFLICQDLLKEILLLRDKYPYHQEGIPGYRGSLSSAVR